jgi:hypothetical protein
LPWIEFPFVTARPAFDYWRGGFFGRKSDNPTHNAEIDRETVGRRLDVREMATDFRYSRHDPTMEFPMASEPKSGD